jgi:hypothetical protein
MPHYELDDYVQEHVPDDAVSANCGSTARLRTPSALSRGRVRYPAANSFSPQLPHQVLPAASHSETVVAEKQDSRWVWSRHFPPAGTHNVDDRRLVGVADLFSAPGCSPRVP